jgi:hypothetical protein
VQLGAIALSRINQQFHATFTPATGEAQATPGAA